jgi:hypothetical protein
MIFGQWVYIHLGAKVDFRVIGTLPTNISKEYGEVV